MLKGIVVALPLSFLGGCHKEVVTHGGKLTQANLARIQKDMTVSEVESILGDDDTRKAGMTSVAGADVPADERTWKQGDVWITVDFVGGQATSWDSHNLP